MRTKPTYPPPIFAANYVVTIRTFAISLPVPGPVQTFPVQPQNLSSVDTARAFSARPFITNSTSGCSGAVPSLSLQQKMAPDQLIQYWRPPTVGVNTALPQSATHVNTRETAATVAKRRYIDASSNTFAKNSNTDKSPLVKVKVPKPLLGVPGKIPDRTKEILSEPSVPPSPNTGLKSTQAKRSRTAPKSTVTAPTQSRAGLQQTEKLKSAPSVLKRKRDNSDLECAETILMDPSQPLTNTLENGTKRRRQNSGQILVCPNCEERYDDALKAFEHLKSCTLTRAKEPSSSVSKSSNVVQPQRPSVPRNSLRPSGTTHNYARSSFQPPHCSTQAHATYQPTTFNAGGYHGYYSRP